MKKAVSVLMAAIIVFSVFGFAFTTASASGAEPGAFDPKKLLYYIADGEAIIEGCTDELYGPLVIPSEIEGCPVTEISYDAFAYQNHLTEVYIPGCVETIGDGAFEESSVEKLTLENGIKSIGSYCFLDCYRLKELSLPESISYIGAGAFRFCTGLESLRIDSDIRELDDYEFSHFEYCTNLKSIYYNVSSDKTLCFSTSEAIESIEFGPDVKVVPNFGKTQVKSVYIPDNVEEIYYRAFCESPQLKEVTGCKNIEKADRTAFRGTPFEADAADSDGVIYIGNVLYGVTDGFSLTDYTVKDGTVSISGYAFANTGLKSITLPDSLRGIGEDAFLETPLVKNGRYENGCLYVGDFLISADPGAESRIVIRDGTKAAAEGAFDGRKFDSVTYPASFTGCLGLGEADIDELHFECGYDDFFNLPITAPGYAEYDLYVGGELVEDLKIPSFVTTVPKDAFCCCKSITTLELGENVTEVGNSAFSGCTGLRKVKLNESLERICSGAFSAAGEVEQLTLPDSVRRLEYECFASFKVKSFKLGNGVKYIPESAFKFARIGSMDFGSSVREIGNWAFYQSNLKKAVLPDSLLSIGFNAFDECCELKSVEIGEGLISLGESAFSGCEKLYSVTMKSTLRSMGGFPFAATPVMDSVVNQDGYGNFTIGKNLIYFASPEKNAVIPEGVEFIGEVYGLVDKSYTVSIPSTVKVIDYSAFDYGDISAFSVAAGNTEYSTDEHGVLFNYDKTEMIKYPSGSPLKSYKIPDSVTRLNSNAFKNCPKLDEVALSRGMHMLETGTFYRVDLTTLIVPTSITLIKYAAFPEVVTLATVCYEGSREQWDGIEIDNEQGLNNALLTAVKHYGKTKSPGFLARLFDGFIAFIKKLFGIVLK